jgi:hypothetical protein
MKIPTGSTCEIFCSKPGAYSLHYQMNAISLENEQRLGFHTNENQKINKNLSCEILKYKVLAILAQIPVLGNIVVCIYQSLSHKKITKQVLAKNNLPGYRPKPLTKNPHSERNEDEISNLLKTKSKQASTQTLKNSSLINKVNDLTSARMPFIHLIYPEELKNVVEEIQKKLEEKSYPIDIFEIDKFCTVKKVPSSERWISFVLFIQTTFIKNLEFKKQFSKIQSLNPKNTVLINLSKELESDNFEELTQQSGYTEGGKYKKLVISKEIILDPHKNKSNVEEVSEAISLVYLKFMKN